MDSRKITGCSISLKGWTPMCITGKGKREKSRTSWRWTQGLPVQFTRAVETVFESVCRRPPDPYLDRLNGELERLGRIAARPDSVHDIIHVTPSFLAKYGIDKESPAEVICRQAEKAYRELDTRFVKMTGRRPYAGEFFRYLRNERAKQEQAASRGDTPHRKPRISVRAKAKGRGRGI